MSTGVVGSPSVGPRGLQTRNMLAVLFGQDIVFDRSSNSRLSATTASICPKAENRCVLGLASARLFTDFGLHWDDEDWRRSNHMVASKGVVALAQLGTLERI
jgi:hypothetical protein